MFVKHLGQFLDSDPCRTLEVRPIENRALLQAFDRDAIKHRPGEVGKQQHGAMRFAGHIRRDQQGDLLDFSRQAVRQVRQQDLFAPVFDEADAIFHVYLPTAES